MAALGLNRRDAPPHGRHALPHGRDAPPHGRDALPHGRDVTLDALFPGTSGAVEWGLARMEAALAELGNPHRRYRTLHVGGTNGKGSVASTWASVLQRNGQRVGLYTSPHLCSFRERIMIDGAPLGAARLEEAARRLRPLTGDLGMSMFEACTLLALVVFAEEQVEYASVEVGLGGRLDATNVIVPEVAAITNVAMDHREYLGNSLVDIAREKAGIIKPGVPVVTAEARPAVLDVLSARARAVGAPFHPVETWRHVTDLRLGRRGTRFTLHSGRWGDLELETPLPGAHQATNAALAIRALEFVARPPGPDTVRDGVAAVRWPGRGQIQRIGECLFVFDVAHNLAAVSALVRILADLAPPRPLIVLAGILGDKDWSRMLPPLIDLADRVVFTVPGSAPSDRLWNPREAAGQVAGSVPIEIEEDLPVALRRANALAGGGTVVVTGSCHTVGDVMSVLGIDPFAR